MPPVIGMIAVYTITVYTIFVKNITFSADKSHIEHARSIARSRGRTLNDEFRAWLQQYNASDGAAAAARFDAVMEKLKHIKIDRHFTRDELNER